MTPLERARPWVISLVGGHGTLTVDGREPDLFGALIGCSIERGLPRDYTPGMDPLARITACPRPVVEVTLRLPMCDDDRLTLVRDTSIETHSGATSDVRSSGPVAAALLDRWLAAHPDEPGGALIAKARELLTGDAARKEGRRHE